MMPPRDPPPEKPRRRRRYRHRHEMPTNEDRVEWLRRSYIDTCYAELRMAETLTEEGLRRRLDGQPSAVRPEAVLPLRYWATVLDGPEGDDAGGLDERLEQYREWLETWKEHGLYDGPTELTFFEGDDDADANAERTDQG